MSEAISNRDGFFVIIELVVVRFTFIREYLCNENEESIICG